MTPAELALDIVGAAGRCLASGDRRGADWVFHRSMTQEHRDALDRLLVDSGDPLAFEAGTQESRFLSLALRGTAR